MGFKWIIKENIPCLYELSWQEKKPAIILRIHKDFAKTAMVVPGDAPIVKVFMESFKFSAFAGNLEKDFGFDNAFVFRGENGDFVEFSVPVPQVKKYTGKRCDNCKGEGIEDFFGEKRKCGFCDGTGKEHFFDWRPAQAISASFNVFFSLARYDVPETSAPFPQLMTIDVVTNHGMHGGSLGGEFSIPLCEWLKSFEERTQFPEIIEAMQTAEKKMFGKISKYAGYGFRAYILHKGGIAIDIPGNATGIYNPPEDYFDPQRKTGCKLKCHNIDTPMQQIALLAGLAALHDRARREIKV